MLENIKVDINVGKLRVILLIGADYNFVRKLMIGVRLISLVERVKDFLE